VFPINPAGADVWVTNAIPLAVAAAAWTAIKYACGPTIAYGVENATAFGRFAAERVVPATADDAKIFPPRSSKNTRTDAVVPDPETTFTPDATQLPDAKTLEQ
jgi:hypothetical protein